MDDFRKIFRGFYSIPSRRNKWNDEAEPEQYDDEERDDMNRDSPGFRGFGPFFGNSGSIENDFDKMFEHFHGDMWRQMEALHSQMEDMIRGFGGVKFPSDFQSPRSGDPMLPGDNDSSDEPRHNGIRIWFGTPSPFFHHGSQRESKSPRDFMLKEGQENDEDRNERPALPAPSEPSGPMQPFFSFPGFVPRRPEKKEDTDLDGKLSDKEVLDLITKKSKVPSEHPAPIKPRASSWRTSVSISRVQRPDGKVEEKKIVRDASGHEESTVTKSIGDQSYTVTTVTEEDGKTETRETFQNMDEKDIDTFEKQWKTPFGQWPRHPADSLMPPNAPAQIENQDRDLFSKLFGWKNK